MSDEINVNAEKVKKITEELSKEYNTNNIEKFLQSNEIEFEYNEIKYRVSKPTFAQKQKTYEAKNKKYMEFLKDDSYMVEDELKKLLLKKGVDIDAIQKKIDLLNKEFNSYSYRLGEAIEKQSPEKEIKILEDEALRIDNEIKELSVKKTDYLECSIENQIIIFNYSYLIYQMAEKFVEDKWIKVWNSHEEKLNEEDENLINVVTFHACFLIRGDV